MPATTVATLFTDIFHTMTDLHADIINLPPEVEAAPMIEKVEKVNEKLRLLKRFTLDD